MIKRMALNIIDKGWLRKLIRLDPIRKNIVLLEMKEFCENQKFPYTAIYIKSDLEVNLNIELSITWIRKILKNELNDSYKRFIWT